MNADNSTKSCEATASNVAPSDHRSQKKVETISNVDSGCGSQQHRPKGKKSSPKSSAAHPASAKHHSTSTSAETGDRQKKKQPQHDHRKGGNRRARNRAKGQQGKKAGSWKKLDVNISFNNEDQQPSSASSSGGGHRRGAGGNGGAHNDKKKGGGRSQQQRGRRNGSSKKGLAGDSNMSWYEMTLEQCEEGSNKELPPEVLHMARAEAVRQVEYFFSSDELSRNVFLRRHMDVEGYIPAAIVFNFPSVVRYLIPYHDLIGAIAETSTRLEVDNVNETLRIKGDYNKWLYPNEEGGFGCSRWIKQDPIQEYREEEPVEVGSTESSEAGGVEVTSSLEGSDSSVVTFGDREKATDPSKPATSAVDCKDTDESTNGSAPDLVACTDSDTDADSRY